MQRFFLNGPITFAQRGLKGGVEGGGKAGAKGSFGFERALKGA